MTARSMILPCTALGACLMTAGGCGVDHLGVRSVSFSLHPALTDEYALGLDSLPDGLEVPVVQATSGSVDADAIEKRGMVTVSGLPDPPTGYQYMVMMEFAHDEREELPGDESSSGGDGGGHAHGALTSSDGLASGADAEGHHDDEGGLESAGMGMLMSMGEGEWMWMFSPADVDDKPLGTLRQCMVMLMADAMGGMSGMEGIMLLFGEVGADEEEDDGGGEAEGGGGHAHGA